MRGKLTAVSLSDGKNVEEIVDSCLTDRLTAAAVTKAHCVWKLKMFTQISNTSTYNLQNPVRVFHISTNCKSLLHYCSFWATNKYSVHVKQCYISACFTSSALVWMVCFGGAANGSGASISEKCVNSRLPSNRNWPRRLSSPRKMLYEI